MANIKNNFLSSILELVRTHFSEKIPPRKRSGFAARFNNYKFFFGGKFFLKFYSKRRNPLEVLRHGGFADGCWSALGDCRGDWKQFVRNFLPEKLPVLFLMCQTESVSGTTFLPFLLVRSIAEVNEREARHPLSALTAKKYSVI
ncbi:hypothetical protein A3B19_00265 [Candidatus Giovannonibacteria bacterium RIFCSPLOWO2_01_FULL_46_32]|uniref:Uncharacterized protein n=1 Tax=Candidatus Giovannonibacteria bacterium RIFCSPLOWO2_01_FULL_46_32 TaxID=1798353 RepID=A0A1F5XFN2_9BACT|nr:MAG: hypothetical protein A3B19_00265 [Candidatus Giovannonibacteria bacterium RIFCSPLOWO2_01_FULL_46_32]